jgi:NAD(P)-dependent dehydrogenase (short-subunit alcohol dehydrogenase family)
MADSRLKKFDLDGKNALITGAAGLLGFEHAAALLEVGAKVVLTDINLDALQEAKIQLSNDFKQKMIDIRYLDVTSVESIKSVSESLIVEKVDIGILINNAAIDPKVNGNQGLVETSRLENFPVDQWDLQVAVGLKGAFLCSQVFGNEMACNKSGGVILNIASDLSVFSPDQRIYRKDGLVDELQPVKPVTYSVIKAGLIGLTKYLSTYWVDRGVRCNALSPGGVYNGQCDEFLSKLTSLIPLGRMANKDEYRSAIQFLCSDASSYMNGQNIIMDGGRSSW